MIKLNTEGSSNRTLEDTCKLQAQQIEELTAKMPNPVLPGSFVSPSLLAYIMNRKYSEAVPLYRQEQQFINFGIDLSHQSLANWIIITSSSLKGGGV